MMRKLIYVPIVHSATDMGSLLQAAQAEFLKRYTQRQWEEHNQAIQGFWDGLRQRIAGLGLDYARVWVYQDGLPVCGKELDIVTDLAGQGSPNHELLLWLVNQGATLVGTEDPQLLIEDYQLMRDVLVAPEDARKPGAAYKKKASELLTRRDTYIRQRIDATLPDNGTGIVFVGLVHTADQGLSKDISVSYLVCGLPFRRADDIHQSDD